MNKNLACLRPLLILFGCFFAVATSQAAPQIFHATQSAIPGDNIYIQGDGFGTSPLVYFYRVLPGDPSLTSTSPSSMTLAPTTPESSTGQLINVEVPPNLPMGLYAAWVKNGSIYSNPTFINQARITGFEYGEVYAGYKMAAWTNPITGYTNPGGYSFRIFGRNLRVTGQTPHLWLQQVDLNGIPVGLPETSLPTVVPDASDPNDPYIMQVLLPASCVLNGGTFYRLYVSNGAASNGTSTGNDVVLSEQSFQGLSAGDGSDKFGLNVPWAPAFTYIATKNIDVTSAPYNADNTGAVNSVNAIQQALYDAGNYKDVNGNVGATVYFPAGTYLINQNGENAQFNGPNNTTIIQPSSVELVLPNHVVIKGAGVGATTIKDATNFIGPQIRAISYNAGSELLGLTNFTYQQTGAVGATSYPPIIAVAGSRVFCSNLNIAFKFTNPPNALGGGLVVGASNYNDVLTQYVTLGYGIFDSYAANGGGTYFNVRNCNFTHHGWWKRTRMIVGCGVKNVIFENNFSTRDSQWPGSGLVSYEQGGVECDNAAYPTFINNTFDATGPLPLGQNNDGETFNSQGLADVPNDTGTVISSTATTITANPTIPWTPTNLIGELITVTGTPTPKSRIVTSNTATTITTVAWPSPLPDSTYTYSINGSSGTLSSATSTTITVAGQNWPVNSLVGLSLTVTPPGTQKLAVTGNTSNTISVAAWNPIPTSTSKYSVAKTSFDYGKVSAADATHLTGTSSSGAPTAWPTSGKGVQGQIIAIINGPGMGQWRTVTANTPNTLTIDTPWNEIPTSSSTYSLTGGEDQHLLFKGNILHEQPRGVVLYTGSFDCAVVNNTFDETGETIYLRSDQRSYIGADAASGWDARMDLTWNDVIADNVARDITGHWVTDISSELYQSAGSILAGAIVLNPEFRRNIIYSKVFQPLVDAAGLREGYNNWDRDYNSTFAATNAPGLLGTIFDSNQAINTSTNNTNYFLYLNSDSYQTTIWNQVVSGTFPPTPPNPLYSDIQLTGASHASVGTQDIISSTIFEANFSGTGTSTGGSSDMIEAGGTGVLSAGSGTNYNTSIAGTTPFISGLSGDYLECSIGAGSGTSGHIAITPTTAQASWGRIFDFRNGQVWLVNGAFDFFWRPLQSPTVGNAMRPFDLGNGANGLRIVFNNLSGSKLQMSVLPTAGGGLNLSGLYTIQPISPTAIYHIGVTFSTNPVSQITTEKLFCLNGTGAINTNSNTVGSGNLIAMGTFSLSPTAVTNTSGYLGNGPWNFGDVYGNGTLNVNDYDGLDLYSKDPGTFPAFGN